MVKRLLLLNGLAVLGAVIHHAVHWVIIAMVWWADRYKPVSIPDYSQIGSPVFFGLAVIDQIAIFGVPAFLFVSGFFMAIATGQSRETVGWEMIFNRVKRLLIPYLVWTVVVLLWNIVQGKTYTRIDLVWVLLAGKAEAPFYYLPLILQLYLLSPWLIPLAKNHWKIVIFIAALLQIPAIIFYYLTMNHATIHPGLVSIRFVVMNWRLLEFAIWFLLGMSTGFHLEIFKKFLARIRIVLATCTILTLGLAVVEWELLRNAYGHEWISSQDTIFGKLFVLFTILSFLAFENLRFPFQSQLSYIGSKSFGIYLIHYILQEAAARSIATFAPGLLASYGLILVIIAAIGIVGPVVLMELVNRSPAKRAYVYLFG